MANDHEMIVYFHVQMSKAKEFSLNSASSFNL